MNYNKGEPKYLLRVKEMLILLLKCARGPANRVFNAPNPNASPLGPLMCPSNLVPANLSGSLCHVAVMLVVTCCSDIRPRYMFTLVKKPLMTAVILFTAPILRRCLRWITVAGAE